MRRISLVPAAGRAAALSVTLLLAACGGDPGSRTGAGAGAGRGGPADVYDEIDEGEGWLMEELVRLSEGPTPQTLIEAAFDRADADNRRAALTELAGSDIGGEPAFVAMYRLLSSDPDPTVRAAALAALGRHGTPADAGTIAARLDPTAEREPLIVRWEAAKTLRRLPADEANVRPVVDPLVRTVQDDPDADVRLAAAQALGRYRQPRVFDALVIALADTDFGVVEAARRSLVLLTGANGGHDPREWKAIARELQAGDGLFADAEPFTYRDYPKKRKLLERLNPFDGRG